MILELIAILIVGAWGAWLLVLPFRLIDRIPRRWRDALVTAFCAALFLGLVVSLHDRLELLILLKMIILAGLMLELVRVYIRVLRSAHSVANRKAAERSRER